MRGWRLSASGDPKRALLKPLEYHGDILTRCFKRGSLIGPHYADRREEKERRRKRSASVVVHKLGALFKSLCVQINSLSTLHTFYSICTECIQSENSIYLCIYTLFRYILYMYKINWIFTLYTFWTMYRYKLNFHYVCILNALYIYCSDSIQSQKGSVSILHSKILFNSLTTRSGFWETSF